MTKYRKPHNPYVPAGPTRARLAELHAAGATVRGIATATGLTPSGVSGINRPTQTRVQQRTADLILGLSLRDAIAASPGRISATGTRRRIQALMALGWRHRDLQAHSGITTHMIIGAPASRKARWVEIDTHRAILATYDALWDKQGPSERVRRHAAKHGWPPPAAWDDETMDDPHATPQGVPCTHTGCTLTPEVAGLCGRHYQERRTGDLRTRSTLDTDALWDFARWGLTAHQAADRLEVEYKSLERHLIREDGPLKARFARNAIAAEMAA